MHSHEEIAQAVAEVDLRVKTGWLSKEEAHKLKTLLKMGQTIERSTDKASQFWTHNADVMLKQYLLLREENTPWKKFLTAIGYTWLQRQLKEADAKKSEEVNTSLFVHVVESDYFESAMGLVMLANAIMIGFQVSSTEEDKSSAELYAILDFVFTVIFVVELVLRYCCEGWRWWFRGSNIFDVVVVLATNVIPIWILVPLGIDPALIRPFAVLRLFRMVKLMKLIRRYRSLRTLWNLFQGVLGSGKILLYTVLVMGTTLFIWSVLAVVLIGQDPRTKDHPDVILYFSNVPDAVFTLFQIVTLDSWSAIARPIGELNPLAALLIGMNIVIVEICLLNLVTATIVDAAFKRQQDDHEMVAQEQKIKSDKLIEEVRTLFMEMDKSGTGSLNYEEYLDAVSDNPQIQTKFTTLEIEDAEELWELIDLGTGSIEVDQFAQGLRIIAGEVKAKDLFTINRRVGNALRRLQLAVHEMERQEAVADQMQEDIQEVTRQLTKSTTNLVNFMRNVHRCIPRGRVLLRPEKADEKRGEIFEKVKPLLGTNMGEVSRLFFSNRGKRAAQKQHVNLIGTSRKQENDIDLE
mmetsp:Transcript_11007/g.26578  ORF Transcript_11007/g.26578 Transcript_11007/m.26578 type:complete len:577 (-) Transcript_11007:222-1952(-)